MKQLILLMALVLVFFDAAEASSQGWCKHHRCTPTPTAVPATRTPTPIPPSPTATLTITPIPIPTSTPTNTPDPFAPLQASVASCTTAQTNWYGTCVNYLKIFGHDRIGQTTRNLMSGHKGAAVCGVGIDKTTKPNRVYVSDCAHNRIMAWNYLGRCSDGSFCTFNSDCIDNSCPINSVRDADMIFPQSDVKDGACNGDDNVGIRAPLSAGHICTMNLPDNSNMPESFYSLPLEVDEQGNLLMCDRYNARCVRWDRPLDTDGLIDFVWTGLNPLQQPFRAYKGAPVPSSDGNGAVWIADPGNSRVLHFPAGSTVPDICLGQPDCATTTYSKSCWGNIGATGPINDLTVICDAQKAKVGPDGNLYVLDSGRDGWSGNYGGRFLVYAPPFTTGMAATRQFSPNIITILRPDNTTVPYYFRGYDFHFDDTKTGLLWVSDDGDNAMTRNRGLLLDSNGNVLNTVGASAANKVDGTACGDPMANYKWWAGPGFDVSGSHLIAAAEIPALVVRYDLPVLDDGVCPAPSTGGFLENKTFMGEQTPETLDVPIRALAYGNQLIAGDANAVVTKVWNDYTTRGWGAPPDFQLKSLGDHDDFQHMTVDDGGRLWWFSQDGTTWPTNGGLHAMNLPLSPTSVPIAADANLYWANDGTMITNLGTTPNHHVLFDPIRKRLLISVPPLGAIFGISNYAAVDTGGKLLVDWVQGAPDKAHFASCNQGGAPTAQTLCSGGQLAMDPAGNLWVNDMAGTNWDTQCGNNRVLAYLSSDLTATAPTPGTVTFAQLTAKAIIRPGGPSYTSSGLCGVYQASTIAADSHGRLWMSGHGGMPYSPAPYSFWEIVAYNSPLTKSSPDYLLRIPQGYTPDLEFNPTNGDLIITSSSYAEVYAVNPDADSSWLTPIGP